MVIQMQPTLGIELISCGISSAASNSLDYSMNDGTSDCVIVNGGHESNRILQLESELMIAKKSIAEKDATCDRLSKIQENMDSEIQELTERLFQEAYKMVNEAEVQKCRAEKMWLESNMKVDMLMAEVEALKELLNCTSNSEYHIGSGHRKSLMTRLFNGAGAKSHFISNSRKSMSLPVTKSRSASDGTAEQAVDYVQETDPIYHREFTQWRENGASLEENSSSFLERIMVEDVHPCLTFCNVELTSDILTAIKANTIELEPVKEQKPVLKSCSLSCVPRFCPYRLRIDASAEWHPISLLARNRIAAVCDFFTYIRYISQGIVKAGVIESYWDIIGLRKSMAIARLGLGFMPRPIGARPSSTNYS